MKVIKVKPVEEIKISLTDKDYICSFNMLSTAYMQEALNSLDGKINEVSPAHMAALVLYSGIKPNDREFTIDEAMALAMQMGPSNYGEIIGLYNNSMYESMGSDEQKQLKKMIAQYMSIAKK